MKNSYQFDTFLEKQQEAKRLHLRSYADLEDLLPTLKSIGLRKHMRLLDIGSGTGTRSLELARYLTGGEVVGIDTSKELLKLANALKSKHRQSNLEFRNMDIMNPTKDLGKFDFVHIRLVIQHLKSPIDALKTIRNHLRPGGKIFLEDTDRDWLMLFPTNENWEKAYKTIKNGQIKKGGDPYSGRKLVYYLTQAGYTSVTARLKPIFGDNEFIKEWIENYAPSYLNFLSSKEKAKAKAAIKNIDRLNDEQLLSFYQIWFQASGTRA